VATRAGALTVRETLEAALAGAAVAVPTDARGVRQLQERALVQLQGAYRGLGTQRQAAWKLCKGQWL
jgi:hypothetical protein